MWLPNDDYYVTQFPNFASHSLQGDNSTETLSTLKMAAAGEVENVILLMDLFNKYDEVMEAIHCIAKHSLLSICERKRKKPRELKIMWKKTVR